MVAGRRRDSDGLRRAGAGRDGRRGAAQTQQEEFAAQEADIPEAQEEHGQQHSAPGSWGKSLLVFRYLSGTLSEIDDFIVS